MRPEDDPMYAPNDSAAGRHVRDDLAASHRFLLAHVTSPGTWWTGEDRHAIASEVRMATACALCRERKASLSPSAARGEHDGTGRLPSPVVDVIHRIRTDPARLSREWFESIVPGLLPEAHYVELVGVVALTAGMDSFARAFGVPPFELPRPAPGEPSRHRPASAKPAGAFVPMVAPEDAAGPEADLYPAGAFVPNIVRALSLVPDEVRALRRSSDAHYVSIEQIPDPTARRTIDRMQMELVAARVSALNQCFY
jgi:hypothetical protein